MDFQDIVMSRYATKAFDRRKVPADQVDRLLEMIRYAASSLNLQPWKVKIIEDQKTKDELYPASNNQQQVTTCSHLLVFCADTDLEGHIERLAILMRESGTPEEKVQSFLAARRAWAGKKTPDERVSYAREQVYLALGNALNGAKSLGFDSCPMGGFDPSGYSRILALPANLIPTALCPIGYAVPDAAKRPKLRFGKKDIFF